MTLKKIESALASLESGLLVTLVLSMVLLSFLQVVLRLIFKTGLLWADPLLRHMVLWVGFLGAALAATEGKNFAWEAAPHKQGRGAVFLRLLAHAATMIIAGVLAWASWSYLQDEKMSGDILLSVGSLNVPVWASASIIPIGFVLILLHTLLSALISISEPKK